MQVRIHVGEPKFFSATLINGRQVDSMGPSWNSGIPDADATLRAPLWKPLRETITPRGCPVRWDHAREPPSGLNEQVRKFIRCPLAPACEHQHIDIEVVAEVPALVRCPRAFIRQHG